MNDQKIRPQFLSVPFKASSPNGITEYNGIAKFSPAGIVIEFNSVIIGLIPGDVKEVQIPLHEILDIKFHKGFYGFFSKIQLRLRNFATISRLPNSDNKVKLKIKREDFEIARKAVEQTLQHLNNLQLAQNSQVNENQADYLPPEARTPRSLFDESENTTKNLTK